MQEKEAAGPRRYRVQFECGDTHVATVLGLIIPNVEASKMESIGDNASRVSFICMLSDLPSIIGVTGDYIDHLIVRPDIPEVPAAVRQFAPKDRTPVLAPTVPVTKVPMQVRRRRVAGGAKPSETASGQIVLTVMNRKPNGISHNPDFHDAFVEKGFKPTSVAATLCNLIKEGKVVRCGYAAYRLATPEEEAAVRRKILGLAPSRDSTGDVPGE